MKNFFKLQGVLGSLKKLSPFKPSYKSNWKKIIETKYLNEQEGVQKAAELIKEKKYVQGMITLGNIEKNSSNSKDLIEKKQKIAQFIKDELILRRYAVFKKYLSLGDDNNRLVRSSFWTFLIFSVSFFLYFGSVKDLSKHTTFNVLFTIFKTIFS